MAATLVGYTEDMAGDRVCLAVSEPDAEGRPHRRRYYTDRAGYAQLGCPVSGSPLSPEAMGMLERADRRVRAVAAAVRLLAYGDNSRLALGRKLRQKGHDRESTEAALAEMEARGYLREAEQAARYAAAAVQRKCWGRRRVLFALLGKGYTRAVALSAIASAEAAGEIDFAAAKARLLADRLPPDADAETRRALLYRYGYGGGEEP